MLHISVRDSQGAVVTRRFDYTKHPFYIFNFSLRYRQLTLRQRGFDSTVVELPKKKLPPESVRFAFEEYTNPLGFFRMDVTDDKTKELETFSIPPPNYARACLFPFCLAIRRRLAYPYEANKEKRKNRKTPTMCFLKDSWQADSQRTACEAVIYQMLKEHDVNMWHCLRMSHSGALTRHYLGC
ncbi:hypothetical protein BYT27DRAFT_7341720 [Phlegmacium glaucopus]|nr:hypothetical protein BYT27DRAFT_7341720 [Phlegmacium glaucopus]